MMPVGDTHTHTQSPHAAVEAPLCNLARAHAHRERERDTKWQKKKESMSATEVWLK